MHNETHNQRRQIAADRLRQRVGMIGRDASLRSACDRRQQRHGPSSLNVLDVHGNRRRGRPAARSACGIALLCQLYGRLRTQVAGGAELTLSCPLE